MAWYKVDDKLHSHPKARRAGLAAMGLWSLAGSHCMDYLTDGIVEEWFVDSWPDGRNLAARLVKVGLWDEHADGWTFHDWSKYQPTAEAVKDKRSARAEAGKRGAEARWGGKPEANGIANAIANECDSDAPSPSPSPVPSPGTSKTYESPSSNTPPDAATDATSRTILTGNGISPNRLISHIRSRTKLTVNATGAMRVALDILGRADGVKDQQRYVLGAITRNPAETEKFIYDNNLTG